MRLLFLVSALYVFEMAAAGLVHADPSLYASVPMASFFDPLTLTMVYLMAAFEVSVVFHTLYRKARRLF